MDDRLREIEERLAKASPGPWVIFGGWGPVKGTEFMGINRIGPRGNLYAGIIADPHYPPNADFFMTVGDAEFVAAAREDIPWLIQQLREAREENERLKASLEIANKRANMLLGAVSLYGDEEDSDGR